MQRKFKIDVRTEATAKIIIEAPTAESAVEYLQENLDTYGLHWEVDEGAGELDIFPSKITGKYVGVHELTEVDPEFDDSVDYVVDLDWLTSNGYKVTVIKVEEELEKTTARN